MTLNNDAQLSIFDLMYPKYRITKPIRLIELFSGYGSQALALKYLGVPFEHWKTCEWAIKSIQAYKDIHFSDDDVDYSDGVDKDQLIERLNYFGISSNYNEPMELKQIQKLSEQQLRTIFSNIVCTNNLVNIQNVKGEDLEIVDTDKYEYIMTYSFPCQDLSLAGKGKGMSDTSTRSGMLWEVERILIECNELGNLPQILLMENVPQVHSEDNRQDFFKWQLRLEELGYKNYVKDLIATDYGIPQTRNRCFMISILGDYSYQFPKPIPLKLKLKDMLEDNVDEKYYLSDKMLNCFINPSESGKKFGRDKQFLRNLDNDEIAQTITTCAGNRATDNFIRIKNDESGENIETLKKDLCNKLIKDGLVEEGDVVKHSYTQQITECNPYYQNNLRIRKLTPYECFALMGVKREDFEKCAKNQSNASLYHLAGDSIVVNVLMAIFKELLWMK